jgi:hypothetical protein
LLPMALGWFLKSNSRSKEKHFLLVSYWAMSAPGSEVKAQIVTCHKRSLTSQHVYDNGVKIHLDA